MRRHYSRAGFSLLEADCPFARAHSFRLSARSSYLIQSALTGPKFSIIYPVACALVPVIYPIHSIAAAD